MIQIKTNAFNVRNAEGNFEPIGMATGIQVDTALDKTSANPISNAAVVAALENIHPEGGSNVEVTQITTTGTKIATITVDDIDTDLYAPAGGSGDASIDDSTTTTTTTWSSQKISDELENKVDSEDGKGLSSNDFTDDYKSQLDDLDLTDIIDDTATDATDVTWSANKIVTEIKNAGGDIEVDDTMSATSENPVQNKVINAAVSGLNKRVKALEDNPGGEVVYTNEEIQNGIRAILGGDY